MSMPVDMLGVVGQNRRVMAGTTDTIATSVQRAGKTQAMLEAAVVESDRMLSLGIPNPIAVYCRKGRAEETRARLDAMGGARVAVQEVQS